MPGMLGVPLGPRRALLGVVVVLAGHAAPAGAAPAHPRHSAPTAPAVAAVGAPDVPLPGFDISWPNCPKGMGIRQRRTAGLPMPPSGARMVVIGLTNGPGFYPNPCLESQVRWAKAHHAYTAAYAVASFPRPDELARYGASGPSRGAEPASRLHNAGYAQARFNLATAGRAGLPTPHVWIDVESVRGWPWSTPTANRALLDGVVRGYTDAGVTVGFYSYHRAWNAITGGWRNQHPVWATGARNQREALARCTRPSFSGGPVLLSQWYTKGGRIDYDVTCPAPPNRPSGLFVKF